MFKAGMQVELEMEAWASNPALSLAELEEKVRASGNKVLEIDEENHRIKIGYARQPVMQTFVETEENNG